MASISNTSLHSSTEAAWGCVEKDSEAQLGPSGRASDSVPGDIRQERSEEGRVFWAREELGPLKKG